MVEPIKKTSGQIKSPATSTGSNKMLPVASQLSRATTTTVKNLTTALSNSMNTTKTSLGITPSTGKGGKKRNRKWVGWLILIIILALVAGGYYWFTHRNITTTLLSGKNIRTSAVSIVYRASTIPSGVVRISGSTLTFEDVNLPIVDPDYYAYSIQLAKLNGTELEEAIDLYRFYMDADGYPASSDDGMPIANFDIGDTTGYNRLRIVLQSVESTGGGMSGVVLDGNLGSGVAVLKFPLDLSSATGQASFSQGDDKDTISVGISLNNLDDAELSAYGWKFEGWLAKMNGPLVDATTPLGVFNAVGGGARSNFTTKRDLSGYNKLVVSLVPDGSSGGSLVRLLPFSAELTIQ
ncbi:hypothetical protein JXA59_01750 [Patescibacteria group bacterium]|nr:hypothetical protein [Patescibacteria group bacterium]